jgi:hypothetical protein
MSSSDDEVRLWDLASMRQIGPALPEPEHHVTGLPCGFCFNVTAFDPSGSHLIALHQSGAGIMWDVDPQLWERRACTVAGRTLTPGAPAFWRYVRSSEGDPEGPEGSAGVAGVRAEGSGEVDRPGAAEGADGEVAQAGHDLRTAAGAQL